MKPSFLPFLNPRTVGPPGLMPLDPDDWVLIEDDFAQQMARREALLDQKPAEVMAIAPGGEGPAMELMLLLQRHLADKPGWGPAGIDGVRRPDGGSMPIGPFEPLDKIGRSCPDDFCLLVPDAASGEYRLVAGVLCFPSRWRLDEKIGRPLTGVHAPVPGYAETLARRVNRVFETLRPGRPLWRANWLVHPTDELHLPIGESDKLMEEAAEAADRLFLRTERQTLTRLPESGAVAFGIKTTICPLESLSPSEAAGLAAAMRTLDPEEIAYKSGERVFSAAFRRLEKQAAGFSPASETLN